MNTHFVSIIFFTTADKSKTYFNVRARKGSRPDFNDHVVWHRKEFYAQLKKGNTSGPRMPAILRASALLDVVALQVIGENMSKEDAEALKEKTQVNLEAAGMVDVAKAPEIQL